MLRKLPNKFNNYNGHGRTTALPSSFYDGPKTVRRRLHKTGEEVLITEAQARVEAINSWDALPGVFINQTFAEILDSGVRMATLQAEYWRA